MPTLQDRFWAKVDFTDTCWLWMGSKNGNGYGFISRRPLPRVSAHRFAYEMVKGPIPEGKEIDHLCRVRHCVKPSHLEAVDHKTNVYRGETLGAYHGNKTHCINGHPFNAANTYYRRKGGRDCRVCLREGQQRRKAEA